MKCGSKKKITRHHISGRKGLCGLKYDSDIPLVVFLIWIGYEWDEIDLFFWREEIVTLCRKCHDDFHILFTKLMRECDDLESEEPFKKFMEVNNVGK